MDECPFCRARLITTGSREVDKYVQILSGPVHVIGYSRKCSNSDCPQPQARYRATQAEKLSLSHVTYGLDVMAYIAHRRNGEQKQFKDIWRELQTEFGVKVSERRVGRLYRKIQASLLGDQVAIHQELAAAAEEYGRLMMVVDGLQPDGGGPKYVLHEVSSSTVISVAMVDQASEVNLTDWLAPYREWRGVVKASLSDNEKALVAALKTTWPEAPHQLRQLHFVEDLSEPVHEADRELQKTMRDAMGQLPSVPALEREPEDEVDAMICFPSLWLRFIPAFCTKSLADNRVLAVPDEGMRFELGGSEVVLIPAHFLHSAGNIQVYDPVSKTLFSGDLGASLLPPDNQYEVVEDFEAHLQYMEAFHRRYMPSEKICRQWAAMVWGMDIKRIAPQHGAMFEGKGMVKQFIEWVAHLRCGVEFML